MAFIAHTGNNGVEYYIDTANGLTLLVPGTGVFKLDQAGAKKLVDFPRSFDYVKAVAEYNRAANGAGKPVNTLIETTGADSKNKLVILDLIILDRVGRVVEGTASIVDVETGAIDSNIGIASNTMSKIFEELTKAGVTSNLRQFTDVKYVDQLPDETGFSSKKFYAIEGKVYKLNEAQDDFEEVTDPIVETNTLLPVKTEAEEGVLYFLTTSNKADYAKPAPDRGFYEYKAAQKEYVRADYVGIKEISRLPKDEDIEDNLIYVVAKEIKRKDEDPIKVGTQYVGKEGKLEDAASLKVKEVEVLPIINVAVEGTIYNVNGVLRKFADGKYGDIIATGIETLAEKPDLSQVTITVDSEAIYVLNKKVDETHTYLSKWVWDVSAKEFKKYDPAETEPGK